MEKSLKRQIVDATEAVKKKVRQMRDIESENKQVFETVFKPMTEPLALIAKNHNESIKPLKHETSEENKSNDDTVMDSITNSLVNNDEEIMKKNDLIAINREDSDDNNNNSNSNTSFESVVDDTDMSSWSVSSETFTKVPFGVRREEGKLMLGLSVITIGDRFISVAGRMYGTTPGLKQLLLKKDGDFNLVTKKDLENYKLMLLNTNAHRRDFDANKPINSNKGRKYKEIIKPLFHITSTPSSKIEGKGLHLLKKIMRNVEIKYWDDPNELVERLKLLLASKAAGNTGVNNEIISIVEELRESGNI